MSPFNPDVDVVFVPQLAEAQCPQDDWTIVKDKAERRKRQTRLNVRAHRKRKAQVTTATATAQLRSGIVLHERQHESSASNSHYSSFGALAPVVSSQVVRRPSSALVRGADQSTTTYVQLSNDHVLLPLIGYNVLRAAVTNIHILSLHSLMTGERCHQYLYSAMPLFPAPGSISIPPSLLPTALQRSKPHELWIDILPCPRMRDNAIRFANVKPESYTLCQDAIKHPSKNEGVLVWADPWDPYGWELTEGFITKYSYLIQGCDDLIRSTNRWRALRGEDALVWEVE